MGLGNLRVISEPGPRRESSVTDLCFSVSQCWLLGVFPGRFLSDSLKIYYA